MKILYGSELDRKKIKEEQKQGKKISEIILGKEILIHKYFFHTVYIEYSNIERMYMRVAGGEFGEFPIDEYSIIVEDKEGKEHSLHMDRPEYVQAVLKWVEEHQRHIKTGKRGDKKIEKSQ